MNQAVEMELPVEAAASRDHINKLKNSHKYYLETITDGDEAEVRK